MEQDTNTSFLESNMFIRTITNYYTGTVVAITDQWIVLVNAAWIADTGRFSDAIAKGTLNEIEPYPDEMPVYVSVGAIVDLCPWVHDLPRTQK